MMTQATMQAASANAKVQATKLTLAGEINHMEVDIAIVGGGAAGLAAANAAYDAGVAEAAARLVDAAVEALPIGLGVVE